MSQEPVIVKSTARRVVAWIVRIFLGLLLFLFLLPIFGIVLLETPVHFLFGWLMHIAEVFPPLLGSWKKVLPPLGCLILAGFMIHRFVRWGLKAKGNPLHWRPAHTAAAMGVILLGCAAAIAMSGIVHQFVWLLNDPLTEDRGRRAHLTMAVNDARQLGFALYEYHETEGHLPNSFQDLEGIYPMINRIAWVESGSGRVKEPFTLLKPGGTISSDGNEPLFVSPVIGTERRIVVYYSDSSVRSLPADQLEIILQGGGVEPFSIK